MPGLWAGPRRSRRRRLYAELTSPLGAVSPMTYIVEMGSPLLYYQHTAEPVSVLSELAIVALRVPLTLKDERTLPIGAVGTIVSEWGDGHGYVVEFDEPFHVVTTVEADQLREVVQDGE